MKRIRVVIAARVDKLFYEGPKKSIVETVPTSDSMVELRLSRIENRTCKGRFARPSRA